MVSHTIISDTFPSIKCFPFYAQNTHHIFPIPCPFYAQKININLHKTPMGKIGPIHVPYYAQFMTKKST
nr:MAG TPA: hypothetical protein [Caudoviricetes sp.]